MQSEALGIDVPKAIWKQRLINLPEANLYPQASFAVTLTAATKLIKVGNKRDAKQKTSNVNRCVSEEFEGFEYL